VGQKALDLGFAHGVRMALTMEEDESFYPVHIGSPGADAIMLQAQTLADPFQESGWGVIGVKHKQTKGSDA
jgi:hypothetical protein